MTYSFRPAIRESVSLIIGLIGASGSGKTFSAFRLASGIAGDKPFAVIDTEAGRGKHYADQFKFDHCDVHAPFRPDVFSEAIRAADDAKYPVIVVDSMSHEHAGDGGVLDWHEDELQRMAGDDWKKRETMKMAAWIKPKMARKKMVQRLLQVRAHIILCFRAEEKIEMRRGDDGKMKIVPKVTPTSIDGWIPICDKNLPYELTASFLLLASAPGVPKPIKLQDQHSKLFKTDTPITEQSGEALAAWAKGGVSKKEVPPPAQGQGHPRLIEVPADETGAHMWAEWGKAFATAIKSAATAAELDAWMRENAMPLMHLAEAAPKMRERLNTIAAERLAALGQPTKGEA